MKKRFIAALTAAAVTLSSPGVSSAQGVTESSVPTGSPEEVIGAAFFGAGPLAEGGLGIVLPDEISQEEYDAMVEETVDLLVETDPETVVNISENLTSGSPVKVEQALEDGINLMVEAVGDEDLVNSEISPQCGFAAVCVAVAAAVALSAVVAQNAAAVTTAAAVSQAVWLHIGVGSTEAPLEHEQAVAALTKQLAA